MPKINFLATKPTGTCKVCGINCWAETSNAPAIWPCGIEACPYPRTAKVIAFPRSQTGNAIALIEG
jgi:hypothetical protein